MARCQEPDGYLFTYNQLLFPGTRWKNLQIEHELYCLGHFIEAGVSRFEATGRRDLLDLAEKSARLIVREFKDAGPERTSGHEEIEIALLRLYGIDPRRRTYLETARNLLERRGKASRDSARSSSAGSIPRWRDPNQPTGRSPGEGPARLRNRERTSRSASLPSFC